MIVAHGESSDRAVGRTLLEWPVDGFGANKHPIFFWPPHYRPAGSDLLEDIRMIIRVRPF
jgi:hypothetical protein